MGRLGLSRHIVAKAQSSKVEKGKSVNLDFLKLFYLTVNHSQCHQ
jgi:hypothetical protein